MAASPWCGRKRGAGVLTWEHHPNNPLRKERARHRALHRRQHRDRRRPDVGHDHGDGADRRHAERRDLPADADRPRPPGARLVPCRVRGGRLHRVGRRHGQHFRPPARSRSVVAADRHRQPSGYPADRRKIRRRHRRAVRAGGAAHAERPGLRDQRADRGDRLDQRRRLAFRPGDAVVRRVRRRVRHRAMPTRARIARANGSARN